MSTIDDFDIQNVAGFEWDQANIDHIARHDMVSEEVEQVFFNRPLVICKDIDHSLNEAVYGALGVTNTGRLVAVALVIRNNKLRAASARDQSRLERELFEL